jgi:hypothetical protein
MQRWWVVAMLVLLSGVVHTAPVGTAFSYQGDLKQAGAPANGAFDFEFVLFDANDTSLSTIDLGDVSVSNGLFTVQLDFTDVPFVAARLITCPVAYTPTCPSATNI